jgi:xanthine permease XanP
MSKKPANLIYGIDDKPGFGTLLMLGLQHIFILSIAFIFPVVIIDAIGGTPEQAQHLISISMIVTGIGTILQGIKRGPVGSGYLGPHVNGPAYLSASLMAGKIGGLPLIFGMTALGGVFEALLSRMISRMRAIFPAEVTGTIVMMVGIEIIPLGAKKFLGLDTLHTATDLTAFFVALITLLAMISFNVWGKGKLRLYSVLMGLSIGYAVAFFTGILTKEHLNHIIHAPLFSFPPLGQSGLSFNMTLVIPFMVATLSSALKTMGDLTTCQKINDTEWKRPDMKSISRGILACSLSNLLSGATGSLGQSLSSSNVGLSIASGATSRRIAFSTGGILIFIAFFPKLAAIFVIMPTPIMGASLVFAACFMILAGIQIMMSRMIDARKTFVIGLSIVFGLSVEFAPELYGDIHPWVQPLTTSALSLATVCAIVFNLLFRIGIAKSQTIELEPGVDTSEKIFTFMEKQGSLWGARKEVIFRAISVLNEFLESVNELHLAKGKIQAEVCFDEFNLDMNITYQGSLLAFPETRPTEDELLHDKSAFTRLSGFFMRSHADRLKSSIKDGQCRVQFHFDH